MDDGKKLPPQETSTPPPLPDDLLPQNVNHVSSLPPGESFMLDVAEYSNVYTSFHNDMVKDMYVPTERDGARHRSLHVYSSRGPTPERVELVN